VRTVTREELISLARHGCVIAIGTWRTIKYFRMNRPLEAVTRLRLKLHFGLPTAADDKTTYLDGRTHRHHADRCTAYSQGYPAVNKACV